MPTPVSIRRSFFILALATISPAALAGTMTVASDDFQGYATGSLASQNGGTGWSGSWSALDTVVQVVDPASDLQGDRAIALDPPSAGNFTSAASRTLSSVLSGGVLIDFQIQFSGSVDGNDFLSLWFGNATGPSIGLKGNCGGGSCAGGQDFYVRTMGSSGSMLTGSNLTVGTTYHIFGHLHKSSGAANYDRFDAWVDPTASEMAALASPDASFAGISAISSFSTIGFRVANLDDGDRVLIDSVRVQVVPEPGSLALAGLALAGLAAIRRRKRA